MEHEQNRDFCIADLRAIECLDSRGLPTVAAYVTLENRARALVFVPSGASTGEREACELRDGGERYHGKGVRRAVSHLNHSIRHRLIGQDARDQRGIDEILIELDGTPDKSNLGANAILAASLGVARTAAMGHHTALYKYLNKLYDPAQPMALPIPMLNVINGGVHADNNIEPQEFMIAPIGFHAFDDAMSASSEIYWTLKRLLKEQGKSTAVGDEGGFAPDLDGTRAALDLLGDAIDKAGYSLGDQVVLTMDCAASEYYVDGHYRMPTEGGDLTRDQYTDWLESLVNDYHITSIEDPLDENDFEGWQQLTARLAHKIQIVGDDLFVTQVDELQRGIDQNLANSILIKVNQVGTLTETFDTMKLARKAGYSCVVSHRSGDTEDAMISDIAVATGAPYIKAGAPCRSDRVAKYNRLLMINANGSLEYKTL